MLVHRDMDIDFDARLCMLWIPLPPPAGLDTPPARQPSPTRICTFPCPGCFITKIFRVVVLLDFGRDTTDHSDEKVVRDLLELEDLEKKYKRAPKGHGVLVFGSQGASNRASEVASSHKSGFGFVNSVDTDSRLIAVVHVERSGWGNNDRMKIKRKKGADSPSTCSCA